jgi:hypothetical protein
MTNDSKFRPEPDPADLLQVTVDRALEAMADALEDAGVDGDGFSAVVNLEIGRHGVTAMHMPSDVEDEKFAHAAFEIQLRHTLMSARALGYDLQIIHPDLN